MRKILNLKGKTNNEEDIVTSPFYDSDARCFYCNLC